MVRTLIPFWTAVNRKFYIYQKFTIHIPVVRLQSYTINVCIVSEISDTVNFERGADVNEQTSVNSDILSISPDRDVDIVKALASMPRMQILRLLRHRGPLNVNEISEALDLPQSTVATNVQALESCGLIETRAMKANKGRQKICYARYGEILIRFDDPPLPAEDQPDRSRHADRALHQLQRLRPLRPVLGWRE